MRVELDGVAAAESHAIRFAEMLIAQPQALFEGDPDISALTPDAVANLPLKGRAVKGIRASMNQILVATLG